MKNKYSSSTKKEYRKLASSCCKKPFTTFVKDSYDSFGKMYWERVVRCDECKKECDIVEAIFDTIPTENWWDR